MSLRWLRAAAFLMLGVFSAVALGRINSLRRSSSARAWQA